MPSHRAALPRKTIVPREPRPRPRHAQARGSAAESRQEVHRRRPSIVRGAWQAWTTTRAGVTRLLRARVRRGRGASRRRAVPAATSSPGAPRRRERERRRACACWRLQPQDHDQLRLERTAQPAAGAAAAHLRRGAPRSRWTRARRARHAAPHRLGNRRRVGRGLRLLRPRLGQACSPA
ncbi:MAG: hypothetical protein MZW92_36845 [Comamonadaceae bacterium]|nr:hypothetical protein [Comamonadaceae bacterium]